MIDDFEQIHEELRKKDEARESSIRKLRQVIRLCGDGIRSMHRGDGAKARECASSAKVLIDQVSEELSDHPELLFSKSVEAALAEYTELIATIELIERKRLPSMGEIDVPAAAYLNGIGDSIGEIRRHILDLLRDGHVRQAEEYLEIAESILDELMTFDYPKALLGDLRRKQDVARNLIEKTRGDVTNAVLERDLAERLDRLGG